MKHFLIHLVRKILAWRFFARREGTVSIWGLIKWWELRRIPYNLVVGTTGLLNFITLIVLAAIGEVAFGEPFLFPDGPALIIGFLVVTTYGITANICFTCGWVVEFFVGKIWRERAGAFGEISFALGFVFSILLTLLPSVLLIVFFVLGLLIK